MQQAQAQTLNRLNSKRAWALVSPSTPKQAATIRYTSHTAQPRRRLAIVCRAKEEEYDLITRLVGKLFGKAAVDDPNPGGLKRMDWSQVKDLECVLDREAAPVESDDPYMAWFRPLLAGTTLETEPLRLAYSATEDGWSPSDFHSRVQGYGSCVVLARTKGGAVIGGYNPLGFDGLGSDKGSMGAFLFTWPTGNVKGSKPYKLPKRSGEQMAVVDRYDQGPQWGPGDFKIPMAKPTQNLAMSKLIDYARPGRSKTLFNPDEGGKTELVELRAYVRKGGKLKYELDGLRWKTSYAEGGEGPPTGIVSL